MRTPILIIACLSVIVLGCKDSTGPAKVLSYPLGAGSVWAYHRTLSMFNFRPIQQGATFRDTTIEDDMRSEILGTQTLHDTVQTIKFQGTTTGISAADIYYYTLRNSTLYLYAYKSGGATDILPKHSSLYRYRYRGQSFASIRELSRFIERGLVDAPGAPPDSIIYEAHPPKVLVFPLAAGNEWTFRGYGEPIAKMNKRVLLQEFLTTIAGTFLTYRIQTLYDWNNRGVWDTTFIFYDNVGQQGLLKRSFLIRDLIITNETSPEGLGYFDMKIQHDLTSLKIQ